MFDWAEIGFLITRLLMYIIYHRRTNSHPCAMNPCCSIGMIHWILSTVLKLQKAYPSKPWNAILWIFKKKKNGISGHLWKERKIMCLSVRNKGYSCLVGRAEYSKYPCVTGYIQLLTIRLMCRNSIAQLLELRTENPRLTSCSNQVLGTSWICMRIYSIDSLLIN